MTPRSVNAPEPEPGFRLRWLGRITATALAALPCAASPSPPHSGVEGRGEGVADTSARARAAKAEVRLGEPFDYEIVIRHPGAERWSLPPSLDLAPFRAGGARCRREERDADVVTTCAMRLALYDLGPHDVPEIRLRGESPAGPRDLAVPGPRVEGAGIIDPAAPLERLELSALAPPVPLLVRSWRVLAWAAAALAMALLGALALRRWRRAGAAAEPLPPVPAHFHCARRLDALEAEALPRLGRAREFFFLLSAILRDYLGAVTGLNAIDLTTVELVAALSALGDPRIDLAALRAFVEGADLVKFARAEAGEPACAAAMAFARELLARTRPPEHAP